MRLKTNWKTLSLVRFKSKTWTENLESIEKLKIKFKQENLSLDVFEVLRVVSCKVSIDF